MSSLVLPILALTGAALTLIVLAVQLRPRDAARLIATVVLSVGGHVAVALLLVLLPARPLFTDAAPAVVEVIPLETIEDPPEPEREPEPEIEELPPPEPVEPEPPPSVIPPEPPPPRPEPRPQPQRTPEPPPPEPAPPPPPQAETIADFTGTTLTNPAGESWQSNVGSGAPLEGPIGRPNAAVTGRNRRGERTGVPGGTGTGEAEGPRVVASSDLSRQPGPPNDRLVVLLEQNYPRESQQLGIEGHADVRIHVHADGRVRPLAVVRETQEGFGEACRRTIRQGGTWNPPLDREGNAVDTVTVFRCTFSIRF